jgi:preprotein translocase subunit YajC
MAEIQSRLNMLTAYRSDVFVADPNGNIRLRAKDSGYDAAGLGYLIERSKQDHDRRQQERTLKKGDRVAILGRGIAVVEQVDGKEVLAVLWSKNVVRIGRREIVWDERNMRWETDANAAFECLADERVHPHRGR